MSTEKIGSVSLTISLLGAWFVLKVIIPHYKTSIEYDGLSADESFDLLSTSIK